VVTTVELSTTLDVVPMTFRVKVVVTEEGVVSKLGRTILKVIVAPHRSSGVPFGQQPLF